MSDLTHLSRLARGVITDLEPIYQQQLTEAEEQRALQVLLDAFDNVRESAGDYGQPHVPDALVGRDGF